MSEKVLEEYNRRFFHLSTCPKYNSRKCDLTLKQRASFVFHDAYISDITGRNRRLPRILHNVEVSFPNRPSFDEII